MVLEKSETDGPVPHCGAAGKVKKDGRQGDPAGERSRCGAVAAGKDEPFRKQKEAFGGGVGKMQGTKCKIKRRGNRGERSKRFLFEQVLGSHAG